MQQNDFKKLCTNETLLQPSTALYQKKQRI